MKSGNPLLILPHLPSGFASFASLHATCATDTLSIDTFIGHYIGFIGSVLDQAAGKKWKIKSGRLRPSGQINIHGDFCKGFLLLLLLLLISLTVFLVRETHNLQIF